MPEALEARRLLSAGTPDTAFGDGGMRVLDMADGTDFVFDAAVNANGRILIAGSAERDGNADFALAAFLADGSPDLTFGVNGKVLTDLGSDWDAAYSMAVQPDGKIILVGQVERDTIDLAMVRYNADGSLDTSFGDDGVVITDFGYFDQASRVMLAPDGGILVAGLVSTGGPDQFALLHYTADGDLDGVAMTFVGGESVGLNAMAIMPGGAVILGGFVNYAMDEETWVTPSSGVMVCFEADGTLRTNFGINGVLVQDFGFADTAIRSLAVDAAGRIVAAGVGGGDFLAARFNDQGELDGSFGVGGVQRVDVAGSDDAANSLLIRPDGSLLLGGGAMTDAGVVFTVVRLDPAGMPDATFGENGVATLDARSAEDVIYAMGIAPDGGLVAAGRTGDDFPFYDFAIAKFQLDAVQPPPPAEQPTVVLSGAERGVPWEQLSFNATISGVPADQIVSVSWTFSDGLQTQHSNAASRAFIAPGTYSATVTVSTLQGASAIATTSVVISTFELRPDGANPAIKTLYVGGTSQNDVMVFLPVKKHKAVHLASYLNGRLLGVFNSVGQVVAYGGDGDDIMASMWTRVPVTFHGGNGNDILKGARGNDKLFGDAGKNIILRSRGVDQILDSVAKSRDNRCEWRGWRAWLRLTSFVLKRDPTIRSVFK